MAKGVKEGDIVSIQGRVTHVWDDTVERVTVRLAGFGPVTIGAKYVEIVERAPKDKRRVWRDKPD